MSKSNTKISVVINTFNAEKHLQRVLESAKEFDEIVICDMHSTDRTIEFATQYNCKIVFFEKKDICEPARNFAIQSASNDWVLVIDADELIPNELRFYLYEQIKRKDCPNAIRIPRKNFFMGRFMHSGYPDYLTRFANKNKINWPEHVHSTPIIEGKTEKIPKKRKDLAFIHLANNTSDAIIRKYNTYTEKEIVRRKNKRYNICALFFSPTFRFFKSYILKGGFRDGKAGMAYSGLEAIYKFFTIVKILESQLKKNDMDKDLL